MTSSRITSSDPAAVIVFVDFEHADHYETERGRRIQAARTWLTYRLEDLAALPCHLVRWNRLDEGLLERLDARAIFISGNASAPDRYRSHELEPLHRIIRTTTLPIFGFCGGFQCMAAALGAALVPLDVPEAALESPIVTRWPNGMLAEFGYHPVELLGEHRILTGIRPDARYRHAHALHVPEAPPGFQVLARTASTPIQLAVHDDRRLVGAQFHPEYWTREHPAGRTMIANFLAWALE